MPQDYVQRELRKFERVFPGPGMIMAAGLWRPSQHLPENQRQPGKPAFLFRDGQPSVLHVVDLSAGGARLQLEQADESQSTGQLDGKQLMPMLSLYKLGNKHINVLTVARCVESTYSSLLQRLTLRLQFYGLWEAEADSLPRWKPVAKDGVPAILEWINTDFGPLADRNSEQAG